MLDKEDELLKDLNEKQREAVLYDKGPSLVIAGAGSGKTRVLTYKIAYLLNRGWKPWNILALTFTNKAAREMKERIARLVGNELAAGLWMGTFHSVFSRILRMEADKIGFSSRFTIYDQTDSRNLIKKIVKEVIDTKIREGRIKEEDRKKYEDIYKPAAIAGHISNAKNRLIFPKEYLANPSIQNADMAAKIPFTGEIYLQYMARCRQADVMDFDDLLLYTHKLLQEHEDVCRRYADKFDFVLVDEYQDTNYAQHCIVWELTKAKQSLCVVGDDAQSIYSFRGANIDNILTFNKKYNNSKTFKLEQNYRSTQNIVSAANSLISHNDRQIPKEVFSEKEKGSRLCLYEAYSDLEEAEIVVKKIAELHHKEKLEYDDVAILYRTNAQSRTFEEALRKRGMPYRIYGGLSFYQRKEIKDVIAYCRLMVNPHDEEAFRRIINYPARGIGQTTIDKITATAIEHEVSLWEATANPSEYQLPVNKGTLAKLTSFIDLMSGLVKELESLNAAQSIQRIIRDSGMLKEIFHDMTPEGMSRQENIQELLNGAQEFVNMRKEEGRANETSLTDFLQEVSLLTDMDEDKGDDNHKVTLMTIHSAKGLEFPAVFIVGMEENLFPSPMSGNSPRALEEERRLFYVAITRAERFCFLSYARSRYRFGKTEFSNPSRFLQDIDSQYIDFSQAGGGSYASYKKPNNIYQKYDDEYAPPVFSRSTETRTAHKPIARISGLKPLKGQTTGMQQQDLSSSAPVTATTTGEYAGLQTGTLIEHERFGVGTVEKLDGSGENAKATVAFQNTGTKQLLLRFARFKILPTE